jgi:hypothetical protein
MKLFFIAFGVFFMLRHRINATKTFPFKIYTPEGGSFTDWKRRQPYLSLYYDSQEQPVLGPELLTNRFFANWTGAPLNDTPDNWTVIGQDGVNNYVTQNPTGVCQLVSDGTNVSVSQTKLTIGKRYFASIEVTDITTLGNGLSVGDGATGVFLVTTLGTTTNEFTATTTAFTVKRGGAAMDMSFDNVTVKEILVSAGSVLTAYNKAVALGRDLVINGDFADWTADDPDGWTIISEDATNKIQEVGTGEGDGGAGTGSMNVFRTDVGIIARQAILEAGKTYTVSGTVSFDGGGTVQLKLGTSIVGSITATGSFSFSGTADTVNFDVRGASNGTDITIDNVVVQQTGV